MSTDRKPLMICWFYDTLSCEIIDQVSHVEKRQSNVEKNSVKFFLRLRTCLPSEASVETKKGTFLLVFLSIIEPTQIQLPF